MEPQSVGERRNGGPSFQGPELLSMLSTAELDGRPSRPPDYEAESRALVTLSRELAISPGNVLQKLVETALTLCRAHSAGISLLEDADQKRRFHWRAIAGRWAEHVGGGTPRDFGPCGTVLDRNMALLCSHPEQDFPYFQGVDPGVEEALLIPFYVKGQAVGTIWVVIHDTSRRLDAEDLRVMNNLATFTSAAYQTLISINAAHLVTAIVNSSDDAIVSKDLNSIITSWNPGAERLFGYSTEEVIGKSVTILIPSDRQDEEPAILERIRRGERVDHYETVRQRKDGTLIDVSLSVSPIKNAEGTIVGASKVARDITDRKRAAAQIVVLAREAEHRAKNVLATVQAAVHLSQADTPEGLKTAIEGRIQALANAHRLFVESRWSGAELHALVTQELAAYRQEGDGRATVKGPNVLLEPDAAQAVAVVVHELATNAAKYGALSVTNGRVCVEWSRDGDGRLLLRWIETGGPPVTSPGRQGFGTRIMKSMIAGPLKGEMRLDWRAEGLFCEVVMSI